MSQTQAQPNNRVIDHIEFEVYDAHDPGKNWGVYMALNDDGTIEEPCIGDVCRDFSETETDTLKAIVAEMLQKGNTKLQHPEKLILDDGYFAILAEVSKAHLQGVLTAYFHDNP